MKRRGQSLSSIRRGAFHALDAASEALRNTRGFRASTRRGAIHPRPSVAVSWPAGCITTTTTGPTRLAGTSRPSHD